MQRRIRLGMVGGGQGAFIGAVHRIAARIDDQYELVAGALSSDPVRARDSGQVLHIAPEAAAGGPLALAESGDRIRLSVRDRRLDLLVDEATLAARRAKWSPLPAPKRGWDRLVHEQVMQAPDGADLRFLTAGG